MYLVFSWTWPVKRDSTYVSNITFSAMPLRTLQDVTLFAHPLLVIDTDNVISLSDQRYNSKGHQTSK